MSADLTLPQMTAQEAETLTEQIVGRLDQVSENIEAVQSLMRDALQRRAHLALGYDSPTAYMRDRFEGALVNLSAALRREIVHELSDAGMSTRAIAPIVGVSKDTVHRDLAGVSRETPEPTPPENAFSAVTTLAAQETEWTIAADPATGEVIESAVTEHTTTEKTRTVLGLDGKTYNAPASTTPRRRSLVDDAFRANTALWKAIEDIRSITNDDRFTKNKADILAALQPSADLAQQILTDLYLSPDKEN